MKVIHLIGGGDVGGAKVHVLSLVKELGKHIEIKIISLRPGEFSEDAREMGVNIEVVKTGNVFKDLNIITRIIESDGHEIIHSHGAKANMYALLLKKRTGLPAVTTVHSDYRLDYLHSLWKRYTFGIINTIALRFVDYYTTVTGKFKGMLIERKFNYKNIYTVYNGMDFSTPVETLTKKEFIEKHNLPITEENIIVGILVRLVPVKGVETFVKAAKVVVKSNPSVIFVIGGDGEERKKLENLSKNLGISKNVFFLGWIEESYKFLSGIDINVLSSISEGFPYSILEGVKVGKPTISSKVGGIPDFITNGINGYLFTPGDHGKLAECILDMANNPEKRKSMAEKLYNKATKEYTSENMAKMQFEIYESILTKKSNNPVKKSYDAVVSGYYGFKNLGDDALLKAIIKNIRMFRSDVRFSILSKDPVEIKKTYAIDSINRINIVKIIMTMRKSTIFIYGGGTLIQESTSTRSLLYYLFIIWIAKKMGLNVMLYANGIEPINKYFNRKLTQKILNGIDIITLREEDSLNELGKIGISTPKITVTADPALNIDISPQERIDEIMDQEGIGRTGKLIGISARKWDGFAKHEEKQAVLAISAAADYMIEKYDVKPVFIPMQPNDLLIIEDISSAMKNKSHILRGSYTAEEVMGLTKHLELMIGMRLHSLVFAASFGIPVVGLVYGPKVESFLKYINQAHASAGSVKSLKPDALKAVVEKVWLKRDEISKELIEITGRLKQKAMYNAKLAVELMDKRETI